MAAMRGRNPANPTQRIKGQEFEQKLELSARNICNCLTTCSKDNLVIEYDRTTCHD